MRESGILMPVSALPGRHGIGRLGKAAEDFIDFLAESGCSYWQVLPLSPTGYGDSPYQSCSCFAGNPYLIDFDRLSAKGWLDKADYETLFADTDPHTVDYQLLWEINTPVLRKAYAGFLKHKPADYRRFCSAQKAWLPDYALFMALKDAHEGKPWYEWEPELAMREKKALSAAKENCADDIGFYSFVQYCFFSQWNAVKKYAKKAGIRIIGDIPIYAAYDSAEVWAKPELFQLDAEKKPVAVAGCPPDVFSVTGQLWGNPLWDWEAMAKNGYRWWLDRLDFVLGMYDVVRIDHFRGFERYYSIPFDAPTAEHGKWRKGPDFALWKAAKARFAELPVIAEDLGNITPAVERLLRRTGFPGMKVMQFAFDSGADNPYLPHNFTTTNCVCYTGTHDNHTLRGWVRSMSAESCDYAMAYFSLKKKKKLPQALLQAVWGSIAKIAVAQMQDFLNSPPSDRINTPSTLGGNWVWRADADDFSEKRAAKIRALNTVYGRLNQPEQERPEK